MLRSMIQCIPHLFSKKHAELSILIQTYMFCIWTIAFANYVPHHICMIFCRAYAHIQKSVCKIRSVVSDCCRTNVQTLPEMVMFPPNFAFFQNFSPVYGGNIFCPFVILLISINVFYALSLFALPRSTEAHIPSKITAGRTRMLAPLIQHTVGTVWLNTQSGC